MSDENLIEQPNELELLKSRASQMGIKYHPAIGLEKLRAKVQNALNDKPEPEKEEKTVPKEFIEHKTAEDVPETDRMRKMRLKREASKLVRIRVACMNPNKKEWEGEIFSVSNSAVGTYKKYVPFNTEEGYHVPNIIYKTMLERQCQVFHTVKDAKGNKIRKGKLIKEFAIEVLDKLTKAQLDALSTKQAMANNLD